MFAPVQLLAHDEILAFVAENGRDTSPTSSIPIVRKVRRPRWSEIESGYSYRCSWKVQIQRRFC
jgi:hypothetical protein